MVLYKVFKYNKSTNPNPAGIIPADHTIILTHYNDHSTQLHCALHFSGNRDFITTNANIASD